MSETFGETARRLNCIAAQALGWRPTEFWNATPTELAISLSDPRECETGVAPSRNQITQMMERDSNG